ncbi:MAG: hypothetical protein SGI91_00670 [Alphaproteobacteria bacterium]|nr:hypothetical protein [Alphaproteobacteria bacterium]
MLRGIVVFIVSAAILLAHGQQAWSSAKDLENLQRTLDGPKSASSQQTPSPKG